MLRWLSEVAEVGRPGIPLACLAALSLCAGELHGQRRHVVSAAIACSGCRVDVEKLVTVGGPADTIGAVRAIDVAVRNARGQVIVGHVEQGFLSVFDSRGEFVRTVGRRGAGPGEYQMILSLNVGVGDTLHVFDPNNGRRTVLSPDFRVMRDTPIPQRIGRMQTILLARDQVLMNAPIRTGERAGLPLHVVGTNGTIVRSFGAVNPTVLSAISLDDSRVVAQSKGGGVWSACINEYTIELWDLAGILRASFSRQADWFVRNDKWDGHDGSPPPSNISALWEDGQGLLWVYVGVPGAQWKQGLIAHPGGALSVGDPDKLWDTMVEVIEPRTGQLLMSQRIDPFIRSVAQDGTTMAVRQDGNGHGYIDFYRLTLRGFPIR